MKSKLRKLYVLIPEYPARAVVGYFTKKAVRESNKAYKRIFDSSTPYNIVEFLEVKKK